MIEKAILTICVSSVSVFFCIFAATEAIKNIKAWMGKKEKKRKVECLHNSAICAACNNSIYDSRIKQHICKYTIACDQFDPK